MGTDIIIRYAESDIDIINIHRFLLAVASPTLPGPVDAYGSAIEVWRTVTEPDENAPSFALMAIKADRLVGTMGLVCVPFWWNNNLRHWANRWWFCLPGEGAGKPLLREAEAIAKETGLELHIYAEQRGTITILNKSPMRNAQEPSLAKPPNSLLAAAQ